jgi:outer membrane protein
MKSTFTRLAFALAVVLSVTAFAQNGAAAAAPGTAATAPSTTTTTTASAPTKVGIINIQEAIFATNEGKRELDTLNKKYEPKQAELQRANTELQDLQKQLSAQGDKMNEDARAQLVKSIEQKQRALQQNAEAADNDYRGEGNDIATRVGKKFMGVLDKYAKDNGYAVILDVSSPQSPVLWANMSSVDVTQAVVTLYNAQSGISAPATPAATQRPTPPSPTGASRPAGSATHTTAPAKPATQTGTPSTPR